MALDSSVNVSVSDNAFLFLLTFNGPGGILRVVNNLEDVTSRGVKFEAYPFSLNLAQDDGEKQPEIQITIDNVDRRIVESLRGGTKPIDCKLELIVSSAPDVVEKTIDFLKLVNVTYDAMSVTGTLASDTILEQRFPYDHYTGSEFPDLLW